MANCSHVSAWAGHFETGMYEPGLRKFASDMAEAKGARSRDLIKERSDLGSAGQ